MFVGCDYCFCLLDVVDFDYINGNVCLLVWLTAFDIACVVMSLVFYLTELVDIYNCYLIVLGVVIIGCRWRLIGCFSWDCFVYGAFDSGVMLVGLR